MIPSYRTCHASRPIIVSLSHIPVTLTNVLLHSRNGVIKQAAWEMNLSLKWEDGQRRLSKSKRLTRLQQSHYVQMKSTSTLETTRDPTVRTLKNRSQQQLKQLRLSKQTVFIISMALLIKRISWPLIWIQSPNSVMTRNALAGYKTKRSRSRALRWNKWSLEHRGPLSTATML